MAEINAGSRIMDIIREHPGARKVLKKHGMMCSSCKGIENETLKLAAQNHGVPLRSLIKDLKAAAGSGR